ncbi:ATP-binding protein, partial [Lutibacter sp.]|uniref:PAS domain-containing sensor histidine kinase n=1 Tax=Lutibacter sp. TaxID=1925666 RepID=UPI0034A0145E
LVETNLNLEDQVQITKEAEKLANTSQAMFSAIAKNFPKGIIVVVNENFEIIYIEGAELHKIGLSKVVTTGVKLSEITAFSDKRKSRIKSDILRTLNGEHLSFQVTFNNNTYSVNSTPLFDENETIKHALFVYSDISEQKRVELEILNSLRKEQELNELKSRFISMASHEFRTPLSAILSSAILIEKQNEPGKEAKRERYVSMIRNNVKNLVVILNDFLSLGKLEEGKVLAQSENFELINFLKSLIEEIEVNTKDGQTIKISTNAATIEVYLDPKLIRHIVTNLVSNAIKYSSSNDKIIINIKENTDQLTLEVVDYGIGIPLDEQKNLFNRFFRAKNATNIQGTGLGLYIVKQYIELIGGNISFSSVLNEGTIFTVNLPMNHTKNEKNIIDRG